MNSGIVNLESIRALTATDTTFEGLTGRSPLHKQLSKLSSEVVTDVAQQQGIYLWGRYERNNLWTNIYFGKAGFGKTAHLQARLLEELRDERTFSYLDVDLNTEHLENRKNEILTHCQKVSNPRMWPQYKNNINRHMHKAGATHIAWVSTPMFNNSEVRELESDLIESLNPTANMMRPAPPIADSMQTNTKNVFHELRARIHQSRPHKLVKAKRVVID